MPRLSTLERDIERRARALRGIRGAGIAFAAAVCAVLGASVAARLGLFSARLPLVLSGALFLALATASGYAVGRARPLSLPRVLLAIDLALATGERLSSLHELHERGGSPALERRIEQRIADHPPAWRRVVRIRWVDLVSWATGGAALAIAILLVSTLAPRPSVVAAAAGGEGRRTSSSAVDRALSADEGDASGVAPTRIDVGERGPAEPDSDEWLEVLSAIPARGVLGGVSDAGPSEATGGRVTRDWRDALSELVSDLAKRAQAQQGFALSEEEQASLRDLAREMSDPNLRDLLSSMLDDPAGDALRDQLAEAERLLDELGRSAANDRTSGRAEAPAEGRGSSSGRLPQDGATGSETARSQIGGTADGASGASGAGERESEGEGEAEGIEAQGEPAGMFDGEDDGQGEGEPSKAHVQGASSQPETDLTRSPSIQQGGTAVGSRDPGGSFSPTIGVQFAPDEILADWGSEGDVRRFLTKGSPFEPPPQEAGAAPTLSVNYDTLRALLEVRELAPEAQSLVRAYFEKITQGGT